MAGNIVIAKNMEKKKGLKKLIVNYVEYQQFLLILKKTFMKI